MPVTPRNPRSSTTATIMVSGQPKRKIEAYFMVGYPQLCRFYDYLELSYDGGVWYKMGFDAFGDRILIEHENELVSSGQPVAPYAKANSNEVSKSNRYLRRRRVASYENHVKPIQDKIAAYVLRSKPKRAEQFQDEFERLFLDEWIAELVENGLKFTRAYIGWDSAPIPVDANITVAQANELDPVNGGKPYIVSADPRNVVDKEGEGDDLRRIVIKECRTDKASFDAKPVEMETFIQWTAERWDRYKKVEKENNPAPYSENQGATRTPTISDVELEWIEGGTHAFGRCPWIEVELPFPTEDLCELNRALFNILSLLDEELFNCTFTQRYATGCSLEQVKGFAPGTGNLFVIDSEAASIGVIGAIPGQAQALMDRVQSLRDSAYMLCSMEPTSTKNVAETAEKKKRDLEALYTLLIKIVSVVEQTENALLVGLGVLDSEDDPNRTQYGREFDVYSLEELMLEIESLGKIPYVPAELKKVLALQLTQKLDPFGDHAKYKQAAEELFDISPALIDTLMNLKREGALTAEMFIKVCNIPKAYQAAIEESFATHADPLGINGGQVDENGNPIDQMTGLPADPEAPTGNTGSPLATRRTPTLPAAGAPGP